jgi:translation initiation factor IF-2
MQNDEGRNTKEADPSTPVQITGLSGVPPAGAAFHVVESDRVAKQIVDHREDQERGQGSTPKLRLTLDEFYAQSAEEGKKELSVVLKSDVQGTCEAARDALEDLSTEEVSLRVLSSGVGAITENDINLASASGTIVLGYNVRPDPAARRQADTDGVEIRTYSIIMEMLDDVKAAMAGLLPAVVSEKMLGRAEIRETFTIPKVGTIAGSYVLEGKVVRHSHCRIVRDGIQIYQGTVGSLRRFKDDVKEVINGMECGIGVSTYNDVKIGDVIEAFELEERPATL